MKKIFFLWMTLGWLSALNAQWMEQNSGTTENLNDVFCITADTVMVVGDNGTILRTTNGGTLWSPVTSPATGNLHRVEFADTQTGYAVGDNGTVLKSTDAGHTWQSLNTGTGESLLALSCISNDTIYVAGTNGYVAKTTDGGQTWNDISIPNIQTDYIKRIQFIGNTGYAIVGMYFPVLYKTIDDGNNWTEIQNASFDNFYWLNATTGFLATLYIAYTDDGLTTYNTIGDSFDIIYDLDYIQPNILWAIGWNAATNGQTTNDIIKYYVSPNSGYGAFCTYDYRHWALYAIDFYNDHIGYVVGVGHNNQDTYGLILKNSTGDNPQNVVAEISKEIFSISPNPAKNQVFINLKDKTTSYSVQYRITDLQGKELIPFTALQTGKAIDVSRLSNGIYLIQVQTQGQIYTQKLLIQK